MNRRLKLLLQLLVGAGLILLVAWGVYLGRQAAKGEQERERPVEMISRVSRENGENVVILDSGAQTKNGIQVEPVKGSIPPSAIVWWEGQSFVYVEKTPGHFARRPLSAVKLGSPFSIVVIGAQQLLSEELRAQIQVLGEE